MYISDPLAVILIHGDPSHKTRGALYIVAFNIFMLLFLWAFWKTVLSDAGRPSEYPNLVLTHPAEPGVIEAPEPFERDGKTWLPSAYARYCVTCRYPKPDRAHHCSMCKRCVLKMDHHCIWLNNCVGMKNYKFFILTLVYGFLLVLFVDITIFQQLLYDAINSQLIWNDLQLLIALVLSFSLGMAAFALLVYHIYLVLRNQTTIEALEASERKDEQRRLKAFRRREGREMSPRPDPQFNPYDQGSALVNIESAIGSNRWLWPVPILDETLGTGLWFPRKKEDSTAIV